MSLLENNGKIYWLDLYIFIEVCAAIDRWRQERLPLIPASVNLFRQHFWNPSFLDTFAGIISSFKTSGKILELKLAESIFFDDQQIKAVRETIQGMYRMDFLCFLDDFGSGFSFLGFLKESGVDILKLGRFFSLNMSGQKAGDVISCLIDLSRHLKVKTMAEGVESTEQTDFLHSMGCDMIQGYVFPVPILPNEFEKRYLQDRPQGPAYCRFNRLRLLLICRLQKGVSSPCPFTLRLYFIQRLFTQTTLFLHV